MFSLRIVFFAGTESNIYLGKKYALYTRSLGEDEFMVAAKLFYGEEGLPSDFDNCYGILFPEGEQGVALYEGNQYYIVTDSGKTYDNITYK
jgi:hypothetical protein